MKKRKFTSCYHFDRLGPLDCRRFVFASGPLVPGATTEQYEKEVHEKAEEVRILAKGYHLTHPPSVPIEAERIGVADNVATALGPDWQQKIFDPTVRQGLRAWLKEKHEKEKETKNIFQRAGSSIKHFVLNAISPIDYYFSERDTHERRLETEFGESKRLHDMKNFVALELNENTLLALDPVELDDIWTRASRTPPAPSSLDVAIALTEATPMVLRSIQAGARRSAPPNDLIFENNRTFNNILKLRQIEAEESDKLMSPILYERERLAGFVQTLEKDAPDAYKILTQEILQKDALQDIANDPATKALLKELQTRYEMALGPSPATPAAKTAAAIEFKNYLEDVKKELPGLELKKKKKAGEAAEEKTETEKNIEKINHLREELGTAADELGNKYTETSSLSGVIKDLSETRDKLSQDMRNRGPLPEKMTTDDLAKALDKVSDQLYEAKNRKTNLLKDINVLEKKYIKTADRFVSFVLSATVKISPGTTPPPLTDQFLDIADAAKFQPSKEEELFPDPRNKNVSAIQEHIEAFDADFALSLQKQIDEKYLKGYKAPESKPPVSCYNLLVAVYQQRAHDLEKDPATQKEIGRVAANMAVADVRTIETVKSRNRELAEKALGGFTGRLRKAKQWFLVKSFNSDAFTARDIIEHISGLDPAFKAFKDLPQDASLNDIRKTMKKCSPPLSSQKLMEFYLYLEEAFNQFKVGGERKVEVADKDWNLETTIRNFRSIHGELLRKEYYKRISHPETDEDKELAKLSKAELFLKLNDLIYKSQQDLEMSTLDRIRSADSDWQVSFLKVLMKGKYGEAYDKALVAGKEKGLTGEDLRKYIEKEAGIPPTILKHLMRGQAMKEGLETGSKVFGATGKAAKFGVIKGAGLVASAWRRLGKPAAAGVGKGIAYGGKGIGKGIWKGGKFIAWTTPKFFFWTAPKWTVKTAAKALWWPFKTVGRGAKGFWNFFSYTPEKAAADAAWLAQHKAEKASGHKAHAGGGPKEAHPEGEHKEAA